MIIRGIWESGDVYVDGKRLSPAYSQRIVNHSPDGFMWGYGGSGPAQLALALLLLVTDKDIAIQLYQRFKFEYIAKWPQSDINCLIDIEAYVKKQGGTISEKKNEDALFSDEIHPTGKCSKGWHNRCAQSKGTVCHCACSGKNHRQFLQLYLFPTAG
jgi:hypothetical protein